MSLPKNIAILEEENRLLRERIDILEEELYQLRDLKLNRKWTPPIALALTVHEEKVLTMLMMQSGTVSKDAMMASLYNLQMKDSPGPKIIDVYVCKLRKKLKPWGIQVTTDWGRGYKLTDEDRDKLKNLE